MNHYVQGTVCMCSITPTTLKVSDAYCVCMYAQCIIINAEHCICIYMQCTTYVHKILLNLLIISCNWYNSTSHILFILCENFIFSSPVNTNVQWSETLQRMDLIQKSSISIKHSCTYVCILCTFVLHSRITQNMSPELLHDNFTCFHSLRGKN